VNDNEVDPAGRTPVVAEGGSAVAEEASLVAEGPSFFAEGASVVAAEGTSVFASTPVKVAVVLSSIVGRSCQCSVIVS
jgi:hypothetical protein